jgi:hypothetical protein
MATAEHREPCDSRGSCTVLGAPGGEIPSGDSPDINDERGNYGMYQYGYNAVISTPDGRYSDTITLLNVHIDDLDESDFIF